MDGVFDSIGPFGIYQKSMLLICGISTIISAITIYSTVFTLAEPKLICTNLLTNLTISEKDICAVWNNLTNNNKNFECHYDQTYFHVTMVSEWNLICDRKYLSGLLQTFYLLGTFSSVVVGYFSDRFGRRKTIIISLFLLNFMLIFNQLVNYNVFGLSIHTRYVINAVGQFIIGATSCVIFSVCFILLVELTTTKYGNLVSTLNLYLYAFGELIILGVSYFLKNWNHINLFTTLFAVIALITSLVFIPESPRYLLIRNRLEELYEVLKKIQSVNQNKSSKPIDKEEIMINLRGLNNISEVELNKNETTDKSGANKIFEFAFKSKKNMIRILFLCFVWFALCMSYYGVSLGITSLGDIDPYLSFLLSTIAEVVGYLFCHLNDRFNRKIMLIIFYGTTGVVCLIVSVIPANQAILMITFASFGKAMSAAAFNSSYTYTSQQFPTFVRNTFFLFVSSIGRLGSIISPQINLLQNLVWKPLPYIIFSSSSFIACLFVFILPDPTTLNYI